MLVETTTDQKSGKSTEVHWGLVIAAVNPAQAYPLALQNVEQLL